MFDSQPINVSPAFDSPSKLPFAATPRTAERNWATVRLDDLLALLGVAMPAGARGLDETFPVRKIRPGETLYHAGDRFGAIYVVRSGFFKTVALDRGGAEVVLGFPMCGDAVGLDGVDSGCYRSDVVALELSNVAVISFSRLAQLGREHRCIERLVYSLFCRELARQETTAWRLCTLSAEARIAAFLLDLSDRHARLGYSARSFALRATRQEIGSYLGLKLETVSRTLSAFAAAGLIAIDRRDVTLNEIDALRRILDPLARETAAHAPAAPRRSGSTSARARLAREARDLALAA